MKSDETFLPYKEAKTKPFGLNYLENSENLLPPKPEEKLTGTAGATQTNRPNGRDTDAGGEIDF